MKAQEIKIGDILQYTKYIKDDNSMDKVVYEGEITYIYDKYYRFIVSKETQYKNKVVTFVFTDSVVTTILFPLKSTKFKKVN